MYEGTLCQFIIVYTTCPPPKSRSDKSVLTCRIIHHSHSACLMFMVIHACGYFLFLIITPALQAITYEVLACLSWRKLPEVMSWWSLLCEFIYIHFNTSPNDSVRKNLHVHRLVLYTLYKHTACLHNIHTWKLTHTHPHTLRHSAYRMGHASEWKKENNHPLLHTGMHQSPTFSHRE